MIPKLKLGKNNRIFVEGKTLNQIAKESGLKLETVQHRYSRGVRDYEGLSKPTSHMVNIEKRKADRKTSMYIMGSGDRLMDVILKKDISITDISKATGIARGTIYSFVYENVDISSARLAKICAYIGVSTDYILGIRGA